MEAIIQVLESTIAARDPYTVAHQQRTTQIACAIAAEMHLSGESLHNLEVAGRLHDLGKVAVPGEILTKPGKLTEAEFSLIKSHSQVGYDILQPLNLPEQISQIILQHHERPDGSGYPRGLKGREILLEAKILAVADVVESMNSHRPYRPALGLEVALEEIASHKGTLYDAAVVDACFRVYENEPEQQVAAAAAQANSRPAQVVRFAPAGSKSRQKKEAKRSNAGRFFSFRNLRQLKNEYFLRAAASTLVASMFMMAFRGA